jgi:hypothetical protein
LPIGLNRNFGVFRRFVWRVDSGELANLARPRFFVEIFWIARFANRERRISENFDELGVWSAIRDKFAGKLGRKIGGISGAPAVTADQKFIAVGQTFDNQSSRAQDQRFKLNCRLNCLRCFSNGPF